MPADAQRTVLVVDDDERFAVTLAQALGRRGYRARRARRRGRARDGACERPDAAIVDLKLGDDDGLTLIEPLRSAHARCASSC